MRSSSPCPTTSCSAGADEAAARHPCAALGPAGTGKALAWVAQRPGGQRQHTRRERGFRLGDRHQVEAWKTAPRRNCRRERRHGPASSGGPALLQGEQAPSASQFSGRSPRRTMGETQASKSQPEHRSPSRRVPFKVLPLIRAKGARKVPPPTPLRLSAVVKAQRWSTGARPGRCRRNPCGPGRNTGQTVENMAGFQVGRLVPASCNSWKAPSM